MNNIFLIGYMCSGKSTLGKLLSKNIGVEFIDLDEYIEKKTGKTVNKIFEESGEEIFRITEREALHEVSIRQDCIIATGGGTPCFFDNIEYMNRNGSTVYLKCTPDKLVERLAKYKSTRPLLKNKSLTELRRFMIENMSEREPFYNRATFIFNADCIDDAQELSISVDSLKKLLSMS